MACSGWAADPIGEQGLSGVRSTTVTTMPDDVDAAPERLEIETSQGRAVAYLHRALRPVGALALGHGAGGGVGAPDLVAVCAAATAAGWTVALVEQPYRVAGRKAPPRAPVLDSAWTEVVTRLRAGALRDVPVVVGGRSAGARVACRTARACGAVAALCLAFPTRPPGRPDAASRVPELDAAGVPVLVVQGETDPYGAPPAVPGRTVVVVRGDHSLRKDAAGVVDAVLPWLADLPGVGAR